MRGNVYADILADQYMELLYYFCLRKTGNSYEAENLTSDIVVSILSSLKNGNIPEHFSAWIWKIARNRYSVWAAAKHTHREWVTGSDFGEYELADETANAEEKMMQSEDLARLRRELAFIASEYRTILVGYYIEDRKLKDIAASLHLPEGTVKARLFRAKKYLKEGMNMAREFGTRSYNPEEIGFSASGSQPSGLPWSAVQRKLPKNILLEADNNPLTAQELAIELGTALPYMEEEIDLLVRATLLKKTGGKYVTNFYIASKECQTEMYTAQRKRSKERSEITDQIVSDSLDAFRSLGIVRNGMSDADLKWWAILFSLDHFIKSLSSYNIYFPEKRENGETWGFIGYETCSLPENCIMGHNGKGNGKYMAWAYKIPDYGLWDRIGEMGYCEALLLGDAVRHGRNISAFSANELGYWKNINGKYAHADADGSIIPDIPVLDKEQLKKCGEIVTAHPLAEKLSDLLAKAFDETVAILKKNSNPILENQLAYCASMQILDIRMMTIHDEVQSGRLTVPADPAHSTIAMYLELN